MQPTCPATVNANDILVAHVAWNDTSSGPFTPGGWTLLDGPQNIGTTPNGRHWVFGKIAAGTEDGAAVDFGDQGGTVKRWGRIYSFTGFTGGTIAELCNGFAATAHATDPQMPTVTTTLVGALAVACVAQNDDNAVGSATGESGGDWVEAVAEYTATTGGGVMMQLQTCTPTGNPGTVSGGSAATTNDPCGVIGFQIRASAPQDVTPGIVAATTTRFTPSVATTDNKEVTPGAPTVATTRFAPTAVVDTGVVPGTVGLGTTLLAPAITVTDNKDVTPGIVAVSTVLFTPTAIVNTIPVPGTVSVVTSPFAPTAIATDNKDVTPGFAAMSTALQTPAVAITQNVEVVPGTVALALSGFAPSHVQDLSLVPDTASAPVTAFSPSVSAGQTGGKVGVTVFATNER